MPAGLLSAPRSENLRTNIKINQGVPSAHSVGSAGAWLHETFTCLVADEILRPKVRRQPSPCIRRVAYLAYRLPSDCNIKYRVTSITTTYGGGYDLWRPRQACI
jgi:hypothetical protein